MRKKQLLLQIFCVCAAFAVGAALVVVVRPDDSAVLSTDLGRSIGTPEPGRALGEPAISRSLAEPSNSPVVESLFPALAMRQDDQPLPLSLTPPSLRQVDESTTTQAPSPSTTTPSTTSTAAPTTSSPSSTEAPRLGVQQQTLRAQPVSTTTSASPTSTTSPPTTRATTTTRAATTTTTSQAETTTTSTTAPSTTTSTHHPQTAAFEKFTDWPIRNTSLDGRTQFVNTPASQITIQQISEGTDRTIALGSVTANKHLGQFRTQCSFSHFAYDDPLVFPGQPGAAHLHMFFGNTEANANSTYLSLRDSGSSSCNGFEGNRSGYWVPAVFDASGNARIPSRIELYYKSHDRSFEHVKKPPEGLGMIAGNASTNPNINWACQETGAQGQNFNRPVQQVQNTIPRCSRTSTLLAHIKFPQCLRGSVGPNTGDASSQMAYPRNGYFSDSCPAGTTYITAIEYFIAWAPDNHDGQTDQWWLSSDVGHDGSRAANGSTLHGDWFGAWNPTLMDRIHQNCIARLADCNWGLITDNLRLIHIEHFGGRRAEAYSGRRAIPASEISAALCPGDAFSVATDAAFCGSAHHGH